MIRVALTVVGLFLAVVLTLIVFGVDPVKGLGLIVEGAAGDKYGLARTAVRATPLLLCGLGVTIGWRAGMYNIGGEGQYVLGGVTGAAVARLVVPLAPGLASISILASSFVSAGLLAALAGWLQVKRGVQCVISTILMNFLVLQMLAWTVRGPLQESKHELPQTERLPNSLMFKRFDAQVDLHSGVFVALAVAALVWAALSLTRWGFVLRVVGQNRRFAFVNKLGPDAVQVWAMALSGGLCGLAGSVDYLGLVGQIGDGFSQGWGFLAIPVALLGGLHPLGVVASAAFFGALLAGGEGLSRFNTTGATLVYVIQAVAVLGYLYFVRRGRVKEAPAA
ncbi:MAG: ABC transporter permease [Armatimonadetes bacterium]|nr:ABC transporter permease [Armatimonadota bacterium]